MTKDEIIEGLLDRESRRLVERKEAATLIEQQAQRIKELEFYLSHKDELEYCGEKAKALIEQQQNRIDDLAH